MDPADPMATQHKSSSKKFTPAHGRDFEIAVRAMDSYRTSRVRDNVAYTVLFAAVMAMVTAAGYGIYHNDFEALKDVWVAVGPFAGGICGYYFHQGRKMTTATLDYAPQDAGKETANDKVRQIGKTRVQFDLTPRAAALLVELKEKTDAASYAEVFKNAMKLYDGIISEVQRGSDFLIRDKEGKVSEFRMFL